MGRPGLVQVHSGGGGTGGVRGPARLLELQRGSFGSTFRPPNAIQNRRHFSGLFWEHSASSPDRPRCSLAGELHGQLDVVHSASGPFQGGSKTNLGVTIDPSGSLFPLPCEAQETVPILEAAGGRQGPSVPAPGAKCTRTPGLEVTLKALAPVSSLYIYIYIYLFIYLFIYSCLSRTGRRSGLGQAWG